MHEGGESQSCAFLLLLFFPPSESDIKRWAKRACPKQLSQNMRGENSRLSVGFEVPRRARLAG
eukprot:4886174-Pleurochrysis_carterae.AAC.2